MAFYRICPRCQAHLDPGEKCDCEEENARRQGFFDSHLKMEPGSGQMKFVFGNKEACHENKSYC